MNRRWAQTKSGGMRESLLEQEAWRWGRGKRRWSGARSGGAGCVAAGTVPAEQGEQWRARRTRGAGIAGERGHRGVSICDVAGLQIFRQLRLVVFCSILSFFERKQAWVSLPRPMPPKTPKTVIGRRHCCFCGKKKRSGKTIPVHAREGCTASNF